MNPGRRTEAVAPDELAATAQRAARAAGAELRRLTGGPIDVTLKDARVDITTSADLAAQRAAVAVLRGEYPDHTVIGEEDGDDARGVAGSPVWYVDPLDGTRNYLNGVPFFCTSVAVVVDGAVHAGAVYDPSHDEMFSAALGRGATRDGVPLRVSAVADLAQALVVTQAQSSDPAVIGQFCDLMGVLMNASAGVRFPGAPALVLAHVAAGRYAAYIERAMDPWDTAAGRLLVEEAGGRFTDFSGGLAGFGRVDVVASNGLVHDALVTRLETG